MQRITTNISNSYMRLVRQRLHGLINPRLPLTLKMLSCIAILYCDFVIRNIVNTKMLKAVNQQTFLPSNYLDYNYYGIISRVTLWYAVLFKVALLLKINGIPMLYPFK